MTPSKRVSSQNCMMMSFIQNDKKIKQDAFAAVPSRRAVFGEGRGPRSAVRALGCETALQPTSNLIAWLSKADVSAQSLVQWSALIWYNVELL